MLIKWKQSWLLIAQSCAIIHIQLDYNQWRDSNRNYPPPHTYTVPKSCIFFVYVHELIDFKLLAAAHLIPSFVGAQERETLKCINVLFFTTRAYNFVKPNKKKTTTTLLILSPWMSSVEHFGLFVVSEISVQEFRIYVNVCANITLASCRLQ